MFIKLTNASPAHLNKPLLLRADIVLTVYEGTVIRNTDTPDQYIDEVTFIYSPDHGTWEVVDRADDVLNKLNAALSYSVKTKWPAAK
jgi:hypothetical protein